MNEIKHIHLGRQSFTISVEAYKELHEYLAAIKEQVGSKGGDVVDEVEMRMAELLMERNIVDEKVVLPEDVQFLKDQLGEPHDFKDEDDDTTDSESEKQSSAEGGTKRFFRDRDHAMFAGVAAGLAAFFSIDVTIIRLIFVLLTFFGGTGVLIYILLWLIVPEARTNSERLQMRGKAVTVDSLKEVVDRAHITEAAERVGKVGQEIGRGAGRGIAKVVEGFAKIVLGIIGVGLMIIAAALFIGTTVIGVYMLMHGGRLADQTVIFPIGSEAVAGLICAIIVLYSLAFLMLLAGLAMVRRKTVIRGWVIGAVVGVFLIAGGLGTAFGFDIVPPIRDKYQALHHTQMVDVPAFTKVAVNGVEGNFSVVQDTKYAVEIKYYGSITRLHDITENVDGDTLSVDTTKYRQGNNNCTIFCLNNDDTPQVIIHTPSIKAVDVQGTDTSFTISDENFHADELALTVDNKAEAFLRGISVQKTTVVNTTDDGKRHLILDGLQSANTSNTIGVAEATINIDRTDALVLNTNTECNSDNGFVYINQTPKSTTVNGVNIASRDALQHLWNENNSNAYNCLVIQ